MNKIYRTIILVVISVISILIFLITFILGSGSPSSNAGTDNSPLFLMIIIAGLVVVIIPGILVVTRLSRR